MQLVDTHCHLQEIGRKLADSSLYDKWEKGGVTSADEVISRAHAADVARLICVGTSVEDSELAVEFVQNRANVWASIGIHPHDAKKYIGDTKALKRFTDLAKEPKVVAVGECGLDYFYTNSPKKDQMAMLRMQIELALDRDLPIIFHVRDAFDDFWPIFDSYGKDNIRGVIHSFSAGTRELEQILARNLYIGLNGITTFTKKSDQIAAAKAVPLASMLLETDAPFLTPSPFRGNICEPKHARTIAEFLANMHKVSLENLAETTTRNAKSLFNIP